MSRKREHGLQIFFKMRRCFLVGLPPQWAQLLRPQGNEHLGIVSKQTVRVNLPAPTVW